MSEEKQVPDNQVAEDQAMESASVDENETQQVRSVSLAEAAKQMLAKKKAMQSNQKGNKQHGPSANASVGMNETRQKKPQNQRRRMGV